MRSKIKEYGTFLSSEKEKGLISEVCPLPYRSPGTEDTLVPMGLPTCYLNS